ncbi:MAG TPA: LacI family DNA-binding transcriptional regulator [Planctomycetota bacterium]|nr:LacI family DNA-binding transcriptional regulator [Planctomycetota bacterium]
MAVTLKRIAEQCGLSLQTVGAVLSGKADLFRPETVARVQAAATELGYRPNSAAKAMRFGRFDCAALVLSDNPWRSTLFRPQITGMDHALTAAGMHLVHAIIPEDDLRARGQVPKIIGELMADGLLINYNTGIPEALDQVITKHRLPAIWMNAKRACDCVYPDDEGAGRQATEHLLKLGHRRIAYVDYCHATSHQDHHYSALDRQQGYEQAMRAAKLPPRVFTAALAVPTAQIPQAARTWLTAADRPTAVVTYCEREAEPIFYAATALLGMQVPRDLSIVTIADDPADHTGVPLATVILPRYELGKVAVELLVQRIASPRRSLAARALPSRLEAGVSTAPPRERTGASS